MLEENNHGYQTFLQKNTRQQNINILPKTRKELMCIGKHGAWHPPPSVCNCIHFGWLPLSPVAHILNGWPINSWSWCCFTWSNNYKSVQLYGKHNNLISHLTFFFRRKTQKWSSVQERKLKCVTRYNLIYWYLIKSKSQGLPCSSNTFNHIIFALVKTILKHLKMALSNNTQKNIFSVFD